MGWIESSAMAEEERLDRKAAAQVMRRAMRFLRPYRVEVVLGVFVMAAATACLVAPPLVFSYVVDRVAVALKHPAARHGALAYVDRMAIVLVGLAIGAWVLSRAQIIIVTRVGERFLRDIRRRAFDHLLGMSLGFFDSEQTGRLDHRLGSPYRLRRDLARPFPELVVVRAL